MRAADIMKRCAVIVNEHFRTATRPARVIAGLVMAMTWCGAAWAQSLPAPDGRFAVGVRFTEFSAGERQLPAMIWYPARASRSAARPYLASDDAQLQIEALARNMDYDLESLSALTTARAHSSIGARPVGRRGQFPILVYSHGLTLWPAQNTALLERLAAHGYIVISIAHPGDSVDIRLKNGTIVTTSRAADPDTGFLALFKTFIMGRDHAARTSILPKYAAAFAPTRLGRSMATWQEDTLAVSRAVADGNVPERDVLARGDPQRLGLIGMSYGGMTAASTCRLIAACRAAVNLDGQNFDPAMFNRHAERPLLLMLSDWTLYPLFDGQPVDAGSSPNDYAYEPWATSGLDHEIIRVRVRGIKHIGFTDLAALMTGKNRDARVGTISGSEAFGAIGDTVLAFLNVHLANGADTAVDRAIAKHPVLRRHDPAGLRNWAANSDDAPVAAGPHGSVSLR